FRPDDKQAWLLALMLGTMVGLISINPSNLSSGLNLIVGSAVVLGAFFYPIFVHFFLIFPQKSPLLRPFSRLETVLYLPILPAILVELGSPRIPGDLFLWVEKYLWTSKFVPIAVWSSKVSYLAAGLICLAINYRAASANDRRRLRVVMAGSAAC